MSDAVVVSTARTGLAKSWRGSLNMTHPVTFTGHVLRHAIERARIEPGEVEDVIVGTAYGYFCWFERSFLDSGYAPARVVSRTSR